MARAEIQKYFKTAWKKTVADKNTTAITFASTLCRRLSHRMRIFGAK